MLENEENCNIENLHSVPLSLRTSEEFSIQQREGVSTLIFQGQTDKCTLNLFGKQRKKGCIGRLRREANI
jgi:hypothetical protein